MICNEEFSVSYVDDGVQRVESMKIVVTRSPTWAIFAMGVGLHTKISSYLYI